MKKNRSDYQMQIFNSDLPDENEERDESQEEEVKEEEKQALRTILGNYLTQPSNDFPCDRELFQHIQDNMSIIATIGNIAGDKVVLKGCEYGALKATVSNQLQSNNSMVSAYSSLATGNINQNAVTDMRISTNQYSAGYVFMRTIDFPEGEILYFEGGDVTNGVYIKKEPIDFTAQNQEYPEAYTIRSLAPFELIPEEVVMRNVAAGETNEDNPDDNENEENTEDPVEVPEVYEWEDFDYLYTNRHLKELVEENQRKIDELSPVPLGVVSIWSGPVTNLPANHLLCTGQTLSKADYPELYEVLKGLYGLNSTTQFRLPDLRGRFIVGYNSSETDYNTLGKTGGAKTVQLTQTQMPSHVHSVDDYYYIEHGTGGITGNYYAGTNLAGSKATDNDNRYLWYYRHNTASTGGNGSHENLPPYLTLAYIMRVK